MKNPDLIKIRKTLEKKLDNKRFEHTLGVAYTAAVMASQFEVDVNSALLAGYLHDCAKTLSDEKKLSFCQKYNIPVTDTELKNPSLLHAKIGGFMAMDNYGVSDIDVVNAIMNHTTGRPEMSDLEKIVYIADYIEPGRRNLPNLDKIRKMAFMDLDRAMLMILTDTLEYLNLTQTVIDTKTQETYEYYFRICGQLQE